VTYPTHATQAQAEAFTPETTRNTAGFNLGHPRAKFSLPQGRGKGKIRGGRQAGV
jgi:hypothetical protein